VCVGAFMGQLDASIATLVLPTLEEVLHKPLADVEWVAIAYLLTVAGLVVAFGRLGDMIGRKALYTAGFVVFTLGSAACGAAPSLIVLIIARVFQAVGAAMLQANSVAIITQTVEKRDLGGAIVVQGAAQAIGLSVGPTLGGLLIVTLGWRWVFYINVPAGILGTALGSLVLPASTPHGPNEPFDWLGAALLAPGTGLLMYVITQGDEIGWHSVALWALTALAAALIGLFLVVERRARHPMVNLSLFRSRLFTAGIAAGLLSYAALVGTFFLVPVFLERALRQNAGQAGMILTAVPAALAAVAFVAGNAADRAGSRRLTVGGMLLAAAGLTWIVGSPGPNVRLLVAALVVVGAGLGVFTPPNNAAIMGAAPPDRVGVAGGILNMTRALGTAFGVAATGAVLAWQLHARTGGPVTRTTAVTAGTMTQSFHGTLLFLIGVAVAAGLISMTRGGAGAHAPHAADPRALG
jgi:EmrB/QacA subfamily drug resistance transporter